MVSKMLTKKERYFIWNIVHPIRTIKELMGSDNYPILNDHDYSILKDLVGSICSKVLHIFEQAEFSVEHGKPKRNELNGSDNSFHRILSYGIKHKHGVVNNPNYSNVELITPICAYVFSDKKKYDYFYRPQLVTDDGESHCVLEDLDHCINEIINLYQLRIAPQNKMLDIKERYDLVDDTPVIKLRDIYGIYPKGFGATTELQMHKLIDDKWVCSNMGCTFNVSSS